MKPIYNPNPKKTYLSRANNYTFADRDESDLYHNHYLILCRRAYSIFIFVQSRELGKGSKNSLKSFCKKWENDLGTLCLIGRV